MNPSINIEKQSDVEYKIKFGDKHIGHLLMDVDGYFYFKPLNDLGLWSSYSLRMIADKIDEINFDFDQILKKNFGK